MSSERTSEVWSGLYPYVDYTRSITAQSRWLLSTFSAKILITALGIAIVTALGRLFRILKRLYEKHLERHAPLLRARDTSVSEPRISSRPSTEPDDPLSLNTNIASGSATAPNEPPGPLANQGRNHFQKALVELDMEEVYKSHNSAESLCWYILLDTWNRVLPGRLSLSSSTSKWKIRQGDVMAIGLAIIHGCLYFAFLAAGAAIPAQIASDSIALSTSPDCASYSLNYTDPESAYTGSRAYDFDALVDSTTLAHNCYKETALNDDCHYFTHRSIPYSVEYNATCPFRGGLCHTEADRAIHFYTPDVGAEVIGVNAPKTFQFRRSCTCSPLNTNKSFISTTKEGDEQNFYYHYGRWSETNYIFNTSSSNRLPHLSGYSVRVFNNVPIFRLPYAWEPIPELRPDSGSMLTMMFIRSGKVYYLNPRDDPIFPADTRIQEPRINEVYYMNSILHATVLACMDRTEWRDPNEGDIRWRNLLELPDLSVNDTTGVYGGFYLLRLSLSNSHTYGSIRLRPESSLDAQAHIVEGTALRLPDNQWEIEAERLFKISLARIQIDARNIARGKLASYDGYIKEHTDQSARICTRTYLFQSIGWTNINRTWFLVTAVLCAFIITMAIPGSDETLWWENAPKWLKSVGKTRWYGIVASWLTAIDAILPRMALITVGRGIQLTFGFVLKRLLTPVYNAFIDMNSWRTFGKALLGVLVAIPDWIRSIVDGLRKGRRFDRNFRRARSS